MIFDYLTPPAVTSALPIDKNASAWHLEQCTPLKKCSAGQLTEEFLELECVPTCLWVFKSVSD